MKTRPETKAELRKEVDRLRRQVARLKKPELERKPMEAVLRESEQRFRVIFNNATDGIVLLDAENLQFLLANEAFCRLTGYSQAELKNLGPRGIHPPGTLSDFTKEYEKIRSGETVLTHDIPVRRKNGTVFYADIHATQILLAGRAYILGIFHDVTERRQSLAALIESENRYQDIAANIPGVVYQFVRKKDGSFALPYVSQKVYSMLGLTSGETTENPYSPFEQIYPEDLELLFQSIEDSAATMTTWTRELRVKSKTGKHSWLRGSASPCLQANGDILWNGVFIDITEEKRMEVALRKAREELEKRVEERTFELLRANEKLQAEIAERKRLEKELIEISSRVQRQIGQDLHDGLGQHLTGIAFMTRALEMKLEDKSRSEAAEASKLTRLVNEAITKTRDLSRGLCPVGIEAHGLMTALKELTASVENIFGVSCSFSCRQRILISDHTLASHLYQIALEAVNNSIRHGQATEIAIRLNARNGRVTLTVKDNGRGISPGLKENQGMGLNIMAYRARMINASLAVQPHTRGGTVVSCSLPYPPK